MKIANVSQDEYEITQDISLTGDSDENKKTVYINNKKGSYIHTLNLKIKIIKFANTYSQKETSIKFSIPTSTISDWMKNKNKILNTEIKIKYIEIKLSLNT